MDLNEILYGLKVTFIGMFIVFAALYVLQLVMIAMKSVFYREPRNQVAPQAVSTPVVEESPAAEGLSPAVVAAISAAIAVYLGGRPANIVSIRRGNEQKTPWQQVARANSIIRKSN